jgi:type VI protein secretion system component VasK
MYAVLLDFLLLALALVLAWLGYVVVRLWRETRRHALRQDQQRRQQRHTHRSPAAAPTEQQPEETQSVRHHRTRRCS